MAFGVLGALEVLDDDGRPIDVGGRQSRVLLAVPLLRAGRSAPVESLIEAI